MGKEGGGGGDLGWRLLVVLSPASPDLPPDIESLTVYKYFPGMRDAVHCRQVEACTTAKHTQASKLHTYTFLKTILGHPHSALHPSVLTKPRCGKKDLMIIVRLVKASSPAAFTHVPGNNTESLIFPFYESLLTRLHRMRPKKG